MAESSGCLQQNSWARPREDGMQRSWVEGSAAFSKITLLTFLECAESRATNQLPLGSGEDTCVNASSFFPCIIILRAGSGVSTYWIRGTRSGQSEVARVHTWPHLSFHSITKKKIQITGPSTNHACCLQELLLF
jgi:hypothetical protein